MTGNGNGNGDQGDGDMVGVWLGRIVIRDGADQQYIYLREKGGQRGFPIVIGTPEALEIHMPFRSSATDATFPRSNSSR